MNCPNCRNYFPDDEGGCPYCGRVVSTLEVAIDQKRRKNQPVSAERRQRERAYRRERKEADTIPVEAELVELRDAVKHKRSAVGMAARAGVGGLLLGKVGMAIGIMSTPLERKLVGQKAVFLVTYRSGRKEYETVAVDTKRYYELMELIPI